jgi:hypothetical protein
MRLLHYIKGVVIKPTAYNLQDTSEFVKCAPAAHEGRMHPS